MHLLMKIFSKFFKLSIFLFLFLIASLFIFLHRSHAEPPDQLDYEETYVRGYVTQVVHQGAQHFGSVSTYAETLRVNILEGKDKGKIVTIGYTSDPTLGTIQRINEGDTVIVDSKPDPTGKVSYFIYEIYRVNTLLWLLGGFILLILLVTGKKGIGALLGLAVSILIISLYIIPHLILGENPLLICLIGGCMILLFTTYIAHGVSTKTTVAIIGTALSLLLTVFLAEFSTNFMHILGLGNQDLYDLQIGTAQKINPQGLLLGSILIGTLGALNDITTTQAITIFTLAKENPKQHISHLFFKSMYIGREHIASLINTLVLAYAGTSLGIFIFFALNPAKLPLWLILNDETTMEEIIRTLVGSAGLILAVPITTFIACYIALRGKKWFSTGIYYAKQIIE